MLEALLQQVKCVWETDFGESISDPKAAMSVQDKKTMQKSRSVREAGGWALPSGATLETQPSLSSKPSIARAEEARLFETKIPEGSGII